MTMTWVFGSEEYALRYLVKMLNQMSIVARDAMKASVIQTCTLKDAFSS